MKDTRMRPEVKQKMKRRWLPEALSPYPIGYLHIANQNEQVSDADLLGAFALPRKHLPSCQLTSSLELAYSILRTVRTSTIAAVVDRLTPLLHMDPVLKLPPEITAEIFSYLDPASLLTASLASRAWRCRILDSRLWRALYLTEGWGLDIDAMRNFEQKHPEPPPLSQNRKARRHVDSDANEPRLKRRVTAASISSRGATSYIQQSSSSWNEQHEPVEADIPASPQDVERDCEMHDASYESASTQPTSQDPSPSRMMPLAQPLPLSTRKFPLVVRLPNGAAKINWPYLYKLRLRLEDNWSKGRFMNFQLPHPAYPEERHQECVYAIQFVGKWLVSGSRDKTVRVWDLETKRLCYQPLLGHTKSVLCLQFDPSPSEDIIISGSSDKSVIMWRFSTGRQIHDLAQAHEDSILNLKFDKRYLVTCSKDKLIKVWNRQELMPTDKDYPQFSKGSQVRFPSYIIDTTDISPSSLETELANRQIKPLAPYSLLMTLDGHGAAVNAIQINKDEIISASGDRLIKVWNIHNGACLKSLMGHHKGIACVQCDNRRIVSGSNDDTVRIYDHASGAEVACLHGHRSLVRTVQADFGDPPGAEEALRLEALAVDSDYWDARRAGTIPEISPMNRRRSNMLRSTGSREPKDIMALGAKIPPGGGGSTWGRIVSGSYDETIIIWRKDKEGKWVAKHSLRQDDAVCNVAKAYHVQQMARPLETRTVPSPHPPARPNIPNGNSSPNIGLHVHDSVPAPNHSANQPQVIGPHGSAMMPPQSQPLPLHLLPHSHSRLPPHPHPPAAVAVAALSQVPASPNAHSAAPLQVQVQNATPGQGHHHHHHNVGHASRQFVNLQPTSRIFKLQFDARKIICASQDPRIVGWDFACEDEDLIEACQLFSSQS